MFYGAEVAHARDAGFGDFVRRAPTFLRARI
jgi:hypothetical protein